MKMSQIFLVKFKQEKTLIMGEKSYKEKNKKKEGKYISKK